LRDDAYTEKYLQGIEAEKEQTECHVQGPETCILDGDAAGYEESRYDQHDNRCPIKKMKGIFQQSPVIEIAKDGATQIACNCKQGKDRPGLSMSLQ